MFSFLDRKSKRSKFVPAHSSKSLGKFTYKVEYEGKKGQRHSRTFKFKKYAVAFADLLKKSNSKTPARVKRTDTTEDGFITEDVEVYHNEKDDDKEAR